MKSSSGVWCATGSLKQLAAIYEHCHLYIGGDTGPMHIASLMGVPVVAIYGPTDPVVNAPYDRSPSIQVRKNLFCSPCRDRNCQKVDCLRAVSHDDVFKAAKDLLLQMKEASWKTRARIRSGPGIGHNLNHSTCHVRLPAYWQDFWIFPNFNFPLTAGWSNSSTGPKN